MLLVKLFVVEIVLLFVQFIMGMINNLLIVVPLNAPFNFLSYSGGLEVLAHIINGALILALGSLIIFFSHKTSDKLVLKLSVLAVVFAVSAIVNGTLFLKIFSFPMYYNIDQYFSLAMAISFISVFTVFFAALYMANRQLKQIIQQAP
jgi:hypothetical protein